MLQITSWLKINPHPNLLIMQDIGLTRHLLSVAVAVVDVGATHRLRNMHVADETIH